jgi:hypothetical protein
LIGIEPPGPLFEVAILSSQNYLFDLRIRTEAEEASGRA